MVPGVAARADPSSGRSTFADFDPKRNAITPIRLVLAIAVLVSHSYHIGGLGDEPLGVETHGALTLAGLAVTAFFILSGFLIASSRERTSVVPFVRNRALRILPGYWLSVVLVAFVFAPVGAAMLGVRLMPDELVAYVLPRVPFFFPVTDPKHLQLAFDGATINGSLWTLTIESLCYLFLALVPVRVLRPVVLADAALLVVVWVALPGAMPEREGGLLLAFAAGILAWTFRHRIPRSLPLAALATAVTVVALANGLLLVAMPAIVYVVLAAAWLPVRFRTDLSYGVYVLAYPIQTLVVIAGARAFGAAGVVAASLVVVLPLAWLSWTFVEQPALGLKRRFRRLAPDDRPKHPDDRLRRARGLRRRGARDAEVLLEGSGVALD